MTNANEKWQDPMQTYTAKYLLRPPIQRAVPAEYRGPLTVEQLTAAVRDELSGMVEISDDDLAWIVEATLAQLGHGVKHCGSADLGGAGSIIRSSSDGYARHPLGGERSVVPAACDGYVYRPLKGGTNEHHD